MFAGAGGKIVINHFYENIQGWFCFKDLYDQIVREMPDNFKFAEIGVWKGKSLSYFTVEALNSKKNFEITAIDTWRGSSEHLKGGGCYDPLTDTSNGLYDHFLEQIEPIRENINILRLESLEASKQFENNYFDAVFIDASHDYQDVLSDLIAWWPKIKKGSKIYGHDMDWSGVFGAVRDFSDKNNLKYKHVSQRCWVIF